MTTTTSNSLTEQIASAARLPLDAAAFLADYVISGGYSGGTLHIGIGEYGYGTWLYGAIYPVGDRWYIVSGFRLPDGRFRLHDAANGQTAQTLRSTFHFEHRCDFFIELTPDFDPAAAFDLPPDDDDEPGFVYVLMLDTPLGSSLHSALFYCGWARYLTARIAHHAAGRGSAFTRAAFERGIGFRVVFTMPGTRRDERRIKNRKNLRRFLQAQGIEV